jgi:hypothetical protein
MDREIAQFKRAIGYEEEGAQYDADDDGASLSIEDVAIILSNGDVSRVEATRHFILRSKAVAVKKLILLRAQMAKVPKWPSSSEIPDEIRRELYGR